MTYIPKAYKTNAAVLYIDKETGMNYAFGAIDGKFCAFDHVNASCQSEDIKVWEPAGGDPSAAAVIGTSH